MPAQTGSSRIYCDIGIDGSFIFDTDHEYVKRNRSRYVQCLYDFPQWEYPQPDRRNDKSLWRTLERYPGNRTIQYKDLFHGCQCHHQTKRGLRKDQQKNTERTQEYDSIPLRWVKSQRYQPRSYREQRELPGWWQFTHGRCRPTDEKNGYGYPNGKNCHQGPGFRKNG